MDVTSLRQELATARNWIDLSSNAGRRSRGRAAQLLAVLWYLELSDRFIHEMVGHDRQDVFDGLVEDLGQAGGMDDLIAADLLARICLRPSTERYEIFDIVQGCLAALALGQRA